ncbi:MAG: YhjD/YihY/BrkB family envelope integrity protein, partial [Acidocella sp.]|nr:YhjD/YihY/BrkB family envelope integrity protein [Acidocella sp.]
MLRRVQVGQHESECKPRFNAIAATAVARGSQSGMVMAGHRAIRAGMISAKTMAGWYGTASRVMQAALANRISMVAAGCAFYATLSLFPAMSLLVSIYGLVFSPRSVAPQLHLIQQLLPPAAYQLISARIQTLVTRPAQALSVGLLARLAVGLWSAASGTRSMVWALNLANRQPETRGFLRFQ